eukprot:3951017-Amphidinium_carterae.1
MDARARVYTIDEASMSMQPMELHLNVKRLLGIGLAIAAWVDPFGGGGGQTAKLLLTLPL